MKERILKGWPYLIPPAVFLVILVLYFTPVFQGKVLFQYDIFQGEGMSKEISEFREKTGEEALWTNGMFGGMPAFQISTVHPGNLMAYVDHYLGFFLPHPANLVLKLFLGFFFLLSVLKVKPTLGGIGAFAFAFSSYFFIAIEAGHNTKINALAYMAPVVAGIILSYRGKYLLGAAITSFFLALEISANHVQITYYLMIMIACLIVGTLVHSIIEKEIPNFLKASMILAVAAAISVGPSVSLLWTTLEYSSETIRGKSELAEFASADDLSHAKSGLDKDYAFRWSYGVWETATLMFPNASGGASSSELSENSETGKLLQKRKVPKSYLKQWPTYWGAQPFTSGPVYVGALVCFLFILGLIFGNPKYKWWLLAATVIAIFLAWGRNFESFNYFLFDHLPMYNKFRAPAMTLIIAEFTIPLLGFWALSNLLSQDLKQSENLRESIAKKIVTVGGIGIGFLILILLSAEMFVSFSAETDIATFSRMFGIDPKKPDQASLLEDFITAVETDRAAMLRNDILIALFMIASATGIIWAYFKYKLNENVVYAVVGLLVVGDLWAVNSKYLGKDSFMKPNEYAKRQQAEEWSNQVLADKDPNYRVFNLAANTFNDAKTSYFHKSVGGYHPAKLRRYQDVIDNHLNGKITIQVLNMLNTKYVIQNDNNNKARALPNPDALGNAWFVSNLLWVNNAKEEIDSLATFEPKTTALIDVRFKELLKSFSPIYDSAAQVLLTHYQPNKLTYSTKTNAPGFITFSEIYYDGGKGWKAYIDGTEAPHVRANYILRGMVVPAGEHTIEFRFEPRSYYAGNKISLFASLIVIIGFLGILIWELRLFKTSKVS